MEPRGAAGARGSATRPVHISSAGRRGAALRGSTARRAPRPREQPSLDAAHPPRRWGPRPASAPQPAALTDVDDGVGPHRHALAYPGEKPQRQRFHVPRARGSSARARGEAEGNAERGGAGPGAVPGRSPGEPSPPVRLPPRARPCALRPPQPNPAQPSAVGLPLPLRWRLRRRWQPEPRPARRGRPAVAAAALPAARVASEAAEAVAAAAGPARRLRARCVSEPQRGANCGGRPLPSPSPSAPLPLPSLPASLPSALLSTT